MRFTSRVNYGNKLVYQMAQDRLQALRGSETTSSKYTIPLSPTERILLNRLRRLRKEAAVIERRFASRGLAIPDLAHSDATPFELDRSYEWKRAAETKQEKRLAPLRTKIYKLQQQANIDLMKATTRQEQGAVLDAYRKALEGVK